MVEKNDSNAEKNQNRALEETDERLHEPQKRPPHHKDAQPSPNKQRQEAPVDSPEQLENPPQTDGARERNNNSV